MHFSKLIGEPKSILELAIFVTVTISFVARAQTTPAGVGSIVRPGQINQQDLLTPDERARLSEQALIHLRRSSPAKNQRLRILSIKSVPQEKGTVKTSMASVVVFNYSQGNATRLIMDASNAAVLGEERLHGRPQSSEEERQEAREVISANQEYARMLEAGAVVEGGFIVDPPRRQSMRDRFIQFQILTSNRQVLRRVVIVNLTTRRIAGSRHR